MLVVGMWLMAVALFTAHGEKVECSIYFNRESFTGKFDSDHISVCFPGKGVLTFYAIFGIFSRIFYD